MYTEAKKLHLIAYLLKEQNEQILKSVENILIQSAEKPRKPFSGFVSQLSKEEVDELEAIIKDGCEQIDESDWK